MRAVIADDDRWVRYAVEAALAGSGVELIGGAPDGAAALVMVAEKRPRLLITDIRMPYLDGISLTSHLTAAFDDLIVLGFTGDDRADELIAAGAERVFQKPNLDELVDAVEALEAAERAGAPGRLSS